MKRALIFLACVQVITILAGVGKALEMKIEIVDPTVPSYRVNYALTGKEVADAIREAIKKKYPEADTRGIATLVWRGETVEGRESGPAGKPLDFVFKEGATTPTNFFISFSAENGTMPFRK